MTDFGFSEFSRELELGRRWDKGQDRLPTYGSVLRDMPVLDFVRGWEEKDKRYFLKKVRELRSKYAPWIEILEEEGSANPDKLEHLIGVHAEHSSRLTATKDPDKRVEAGRAWRRNVQRWCAEVPKVDEDLEAFVRGLPSEYKEGQWAQMKEVDLTLTALVEVLKREVEGGVSLDYH